MIDAKLTEAGEVPVTAVEDLTRAVNAALEADDPVKSYDLLQRLVRTAPDSAQLQTTAGLVALQLDRQGEASLHFARALKFAPDDYVTNYNMALTEMRNERYDLALERLNHLRRQDAGNVDVLNDIGVVWLQKNRLTRALAFFSRAMKLNPDHSMARNNAMELCLTRGLTEPATRLLSDQEKCPYLSPRALAEIHRWQQILNDPNCLRNGSTPIGAGQVN